MTWLWVMMLGGALAVSSRFEKAQAPRYGADVKHAPA